MATLGLSRRVIATETARGTLDPSHCCCAHYALQRLSDLSSSFSVSCASLNHNILLLLLLLVVLAHRVKTKQNKKCELWRNIVFIVQLGFSMLKELNIRGHHPSE